MDPGPLVLVAVGLLLVLIFFLLSEGRYFGGDLYRRLRRRLAPPDLGPPGLGPPGQDGEGTEDD